MRLRRWLVALAVGAAAGKKRRKARDSSSSGGLTTMTVGDTGLVVRISDGPAASSLREWAKDIGDGGATFGEATMREAAVAARISSGDWPSSAYDEYQRIAAGSGNVDSAALLLSYGVGATVAEYAASEPLLRAIAEGDAAGTRALLEDGAADADARVPDGTTALHAAALVGCGACAALVLDHSLDASALLEAVGRRCVTDTRHARGEMARSSVLHHSAEKNAARDLGRRPLSPQHSAGCLTAAMLTSIAHHTHALLARVLLAANLTPSGMLRCSCATTTMIFCMLTVVDAGRLKAQDDGALRFRHVAGRYAYRPEGRCDAESAVRRAHAWRERERA